MLMIIVQHQNFGQVSDLINSYPISHCDEQWLTFISSDDPQRLTGNKAYDYGFRNGRAEIDRLADDAAQERCFG